MTWDIRYIDEGFLFWIIPSTYLFHEAINWVCTAGVAVFAFIRFYIDFSVYDHYYIIVASCFITCVLFHQSLALILLYHEYFLFDITCYLSICFCVLVFTTWFSIHVYDSNLSIHVCLSLTLFGIHHTTRWGVLTPLDPHVQIPELETCEFSRLLIKVAQ